MQPWQQSDYEVESVQLCSARSNDTVEAFPFPDKLNILLVDDSAAILKMVSSILIRQGHTVTEALNGSNALKKIEAIRTTSELKPFDVVIVDLQMPVMDGK